MIPIAFDWSLVKAIGYMEHYHIIAAFSSCHNLTSGTAARRRKSPSVDMPENHAAFPPIHDIHPIATTVRQRDGEILIDFSSGYAERQMWKNSR